MADETDRPQSDPQETDADAQRLPGETDQGHGRHVLVLYAGVAVIAAAAGYATAMMAGCSGNGPPVPPDAAPVTIGEDPQEVLYVDFEPITVNLDEPRLARYISVKLALAIPADRADQETLGLIESKRRVLSDWLTGYFASCSLEDVRGAVNMGRMRREILDAFNEKLWPDQKPRITQVLFTRFTVS